MTEEYAFTKLVHNLLRRDRCIRCNATGMSWEQVQYNDGSYSRDIVLVECPACMRREINTGDADDE